MAVEKGACDIIIGLSPVCEAPRRGPFKHHELPQIYFQSFVLCIINVFVFFFIVYEAHLCPLPYLYSRMFIMLHGTAINASNVSTNVCYNITCSKCTKITISTVSHTIQSRTVLHTQYFGRE